MAEVKAKLSYFRASPQKMRRWANLIRGKSVKEAAAYLKFAPLGPARAIEKLLNSANANAKNSRVKSENLFVKEIKIDEGPTLKRFMPRAFGRAYQIRKRTSHIYLVLSDERNQAHKKSAAKVKTK
ncbi:50S ribosomal protein L22 [Candidatus Giovannonibacteria bacterium]|nr:50S ribosomal protein L22 [Candidatus Giovannonibacteria bacterium]